MWQGTARATESQQSYSTNFPLTENPISESGNWANYASSVFNNPVSTTGGHAVGLNSTGFNDSIAQLVGNYGPNQTITAVAYHPGASGAAEIELHLRMDTHANGDVFTYEVDIIPSLSEINLVDWHGAQGTITQLTTGAITGVADGDTFVASLIGNQFTIKQNGTTIISFNQPNARTFGTPGIGLDAGTPTNGANFGWKSFSVTTY